MQQVLRFSSASPAETAAIGRALGRLLECGDIVCLTGDLGAGKTCLARGIAQGLGVDPVDVASPTFTLAREYRGTVPVYHLDLYRLSGDDDVEAAGLDEYIGGDGVALVEWPQVYAALESMDRLVVQICPARDHDGRELSLIAHGPRYVNILEAMTLC